jgi:uncharacterized protein YqgV (UPF0045/DUF77 family)
MIVAFSVAPAGGEPGNDPADDETGSISAAVARAVRVVADSGLPYELNAMFTLIEGEWDEVMDVVRRAVEAASAGATRTSLVLKADIRPGLHGRVARQGRPGPAAPLQALTAIVLTAVSRARLGYSHLLGRPIIWVPMKG